MSKNVYIIAEAGVNHNGELSRAFDLVDIAAETGADAVKFQTFKADELTTQRAETCDYQRSATKGAVSQQDMLRALELSEEEFCMLAEHCAKKNIEFMSTGFDIKSLDFLTSKTKIKRVKIPSGEMVNPFLLLHAARTNLPIIISTGLASLEEVKLSIGVISYGLAHPHSIPTREEALEQLESKQNYDLLREKITILHCTSAYPAPMSDINLNAIRTLHDEFELDIGFSDHSQGINASLGAVAVGAKVIEKHFTLDKNLPGPDHKASLSPKELNELVSGIRDIERALGSGQKQPSSSESKNKLAVRGSLVASCKISKDEILTEENLTAKRPGDGLHPMAFLDLNGQKASKQYDPDDLIKE
ncbi:N-acetylneuraminate synthase [Curvivirga aplysinae]|uniref:N-acetylneuraminate synthase n=1 Tax=Curvivirga aplysinae TaxID=2529852 RepID=UPI0012BBA63C|nr:N-acetylneuraminate synthase [Curvivirga aplysinae]MTI11390.1 N-acetylneuraminate synthase [Curvivirga aplysinae]